MCADAIHHERIPVDLDLRLLHATTEPLGKAPAITPDWSSNMQWKFLLALIFCYAVFAAPAQATNWYISKRTSYNTIADGRSWYTAWRDLSTFGPDWTKIQPGDHIYIDAGAAGSFLYYDYPLVIRKSGTSTAPIYIEVAPASDTIHGGGCAIIKAPAFYPQTYPVWYTGPRETVKPGINVGNYTNIVIRGSRWIPSSALAKEPNLRVYGPFTSTGTELYDSVGISVGAQARAIKFENISVAACAKGVHIQGGESSCKSMMIYDNDVNILYKSDIASRGELRDSILYDRRKTGVGISLDGQPALAGEPRFGIYSSILGPGLTTTIDLVSAKVGVVCFNSLLNNPSVAQVKMTKTPETFVTLWTNCFFQTPLNAKGLGHSNLSFSSISATNPYVSNNIFWGGAVSVVGTRRLGTNTQYKTTGNTLVLSSAQVDPKFVTDLSKVPSTASWYQLAALDFTLAADAATGFTGYFPTSIKSFLSTK